MSKRVANTRSKTARNGRVRLGFYTRRRLNAKAEAKEKRQGEITAKLERRLEPQQPPPKQPGKFVGMMRRMFSRRGNR